MRDFLGLLVNIKIIHKKEKRLLRKYNIYILNCFMANKKLLFVTSNPSQLKVFRNKLNALSKESDIYLLIYTYGFKNRKLKNNIYEWTKDLKN